MKKQSDQKHSSQDTVAPMPERETNHDDKRLMPVFDCVQPFVSRTDPNWPIPDDATCFSWWERFDMMDHIKAHSLQVAAVATDLAEQAVAAGHDASVSAVRASALLHDIAKTYTIRHGGNHAQIGGAWTAALTKNPVIAQGVMHHVHWPFTRDLDRDLLPLLVCYSDKRVRHNEVVTLNERFDDLIERYGHTEYIRDRIRENLADSLELEQQLERYLKADLHEDPFHSGRLV